MSLNFDRSLGRLLCCLVLVPVLAGCNASSSTTGGGTSATGQTGAAPAAAAGLPPDLVTKVEALIRLTSEYNTLAAQVTTGEAFVQHRDELSRIDQELQPYIEDVSIAEAKLPASQKQLFHNTYYDKKAFPLMQEKSVHTRRIQGLVR